MADTYTFQDIFQYVDTAVTNYVTDGAANAAGALAGVGQTLLIIYVMLWGWSMMRGLIQEPVMDGVWRLVKVSAIFGLATSSALYASYVSNFLYDWPTAFAGVMQGGAVQNSAQLLDQMLDKGNTLGSQAWEKASWSNMGAYFLSIIIYAVTWIVTAITGFIIIMAKYALAILLAVGPVFILAMMFEPTRQWFDKWLGSVVTAGLTIVMVVMAAALMFKLLNATYDAIQLDANANSGVAAMKTIGPLVVYGIICVFTIMGMPSLAGSIGGAFALANASALGWSYNKIRSATPAALRMGKRAGQAGYRGLRGAAGRFGRGSEGGSVTGSRASPPGAIYRKITSGSSRRARAA